jgi:hypothetical protein
VRRQPRAARPSRSNLTLCAARLDAGAALLGRARPAGEIACRPEAPPALCVRVSALTFPDIPDLHSHFPVAGKRKAADEENAGQSPRKTIKSAAALDDLYPYKAICTATRDGGFAPAWELALYALIFLAQDAVRSTIGKRARGADTASTPCPFANALRAAPFKEKVRADGVHVGCKWSPVGFRLWRSSGRVGDGACACAECSVTCCAGCAVRRPTVQRCANRPTVAHVVSGLCTSQNWWTCEAAGHSKGKRRSNPLMYAHIQRPALMSQMLERDVHPRTGDA